nr:DUF333 domain-containing protein [Neisseria viridiae]
MRQSVWQIPLPNSALPKAADGKQKKDESGGGYALCHLPDSRIVEEWEYFRSQH